MKVALIGTSHVGPLAIAFRQLPDAATLPWRFFAVPNGFANRQGLRALSLDVEARQLTGFPTNDPHTKRAVSVDSFDAFFVIGGQPSALNHARLFGPHFSKAFQTAALDDMFRNSRNFYVTQMIRTISDAPIYTACEYAPPPGDRTMPDALGLAESAMTAFWQSQDATFLPQAAALLNENGQTPARHFISDTDRHLVPDSAALVIAQFRQTLGV